MEGGREGGVDTNHKTREKRRTCTISVPSFSLIDWEPLFCFLAVEEVEDFAVEVTEEPSPKSREVREVSTASMNDQGTQERVL